MMVRLSKKRKTKVVKAADVYFLMNDVLCSMQVNDRAKEHLWVIGLKRNNDINYLQWVDWVSMGNIHSTIADPSQIFKTAIIKNTSSIILVHNHPSGNKLPSETDHKLTKKITACGQLLDIAVLDHIILTTDAGYYSFAEEGNL